MFSQGQPRYYAEEQALLPPLGLLSVAGYLLEKCPRHEVRVLDMPALNLGPEGLASHLSDFRPDIVGLSCLTNLLVDTLLTARAAKQAWPGAPVVLGGFHTQLFPRETLAMPEVDAVVIGAGEIPFARLLEGFEASGRIPRLPGVIPRGEEVGELAGEIQTVEEPDLLPLPARHLTPYRLYYSAAGVSTPTTMVMTSFGCPFRCIFCNTSHVRKMTFKSAARIAEEFSACVRLGIREIWVLDENFTVNRGRVLALSEEIRRRGLRVPWSIKSRVDLVDVELLRALKHAGCTSIHFGVESGDERMLEFIRKDITKEQVRRAFRLARAEGLEVTASFMLGFPGETRAQIKATIAFALELEPNYVQFSVAIPLPGTDLYRMGLERGLFPRDHWQEFARNPTASFRPPVWNEIFSREELEDLLDTAYRRFYLRPRYVWRRVRRLHSLDELRRDLQIGLRFLTRR